MGERARNLAVGLTVIVALVLLGGLILIFTGLPEVFQTGYEIRILLDTTHDIHEGDPIYLVGMRVGRITRIEITDADPRKGVTLMARINRNVKLPGNTNVFIFTKGVVGVPYIALIAEGPPRYDEHGNVMEYLPTDRLITLRGIHRGGGILPPELTKGLEDLAKLAATLNSLLTPEEEPQPTTAPASGPATTQGATTAPTTRPIPPGLKGTIVRLNRALNDIDVILGDPQNQTNIKTALASLAKVGDVMKAVQDFASEGSKAIGEAKTVAQQAGKTFDNINKTTTRASQDLNDLAKKLMEDAEKISTLMSTFNRVIVKMDEGEGSAGKLLNDPKLYNSLVEAAQQMSKLMVDFRQLLEEWKKNGLPLKLK